MGRFLKGGLFAVALAAVILTVDLLFLRHRFALRLAVNVGVALLFLGIYWRFFARH